MLLPVGHILPDPLAHEVVEEIITIDAGPGLSVAIELDDEQMIEVRNTSEMIFYVGVNEAEDTIYVFSSQDLLLLSVSLYKPDSHILISEMKIVVNQEDNARIKVDLQDMDGGSLVIGELPYVD